MERRSFIRIAALGASAGIIAPGIILAGDAGKLISDNKLAGKLYYTKESPGRWEKKAGSHSPIIQTSKGADGDLYVDVITGHPMKAHEHYITKHILLDKDFNFITEKVFDPLKDKQAVSKFEIKPYQGTLYALSVCNLHDSWLTMVEV